MGATDSGRPRPPRLVSVFCAGVITTGVVLWTFTSVELPLPNAQRLTDQQLTARPPPAEASGCQCLLQMHCPRYNFDFPQQQQGGAHCSIYSFRYRSAKTCLDWRRRNFGHSSHVVLLGDLRLLYLYRYMRDELLSDTERTDGPKFCKSVHTNWTHAYLMEDREMAHTQPLPPCYYLAINKLAKLEYYWTDDSHWDAILRKLVRRCQLGVCPAVVVVSSRLDLILRAYEERRELSLSAVSRTVNKTLPLLETLAAYGVHVWWKPHENLLDASTATEDVTAINEIIQQHNLRLMSALSGSSIPVWTSSAAVGWGHHQHCSGAAWLSSGADNRTTSADFRCSQPYYLGNWAQKQYMDIIFNFLCGRAQSMTQNPCCAGWS